MATAEHEVIGEIFAKPTFNDIYIFFTSDLRDGKKI